MGALQSRRSRRQSPQLYSSLKLNYVHLLRCPRDVCVLASLVDESVPNQTLKSNADVEICVGLLEFVRTSIREELMTSNRDNPLICQKIDDFRSIMEQLERNLPNIWSKVYDLSSDHERDVWFTH